MLQFSRFWPTLACTTPYQSLSKGHGWDLWCNGRRWGTNIDRDQMHESVRHKEYSLIKLYLPEGKIQWDGQPLAGEASFYFAPDPSEPSVEKRYMPHRNKWDDFASKICLLLFLTCCWRASRSSLQLSTAIRQFLVRGIGGKPKLFTLCGRRYT